MVGLPEFLSEKASFLGFLRRRHERSRRIVACLSKLEGWSIEDLEDVNKRIGMLTLVPPDDIQVINLTWLELPVGESKVFTASQG